MHCKLFSRKCQRKPVSVFRFVSLIFLIHQGKSFASKFYVIALTEKIQALNNSSASLHLWERGLVDLAFDLQQ